MTRIVFFMFLCTLLAAGWWQARSDLAFADYYVLEAEIRAGRSEVSDLERLDRVLAYRSDTAMPCDIRVQRMIAILSLYRADLLARVHGVNPLARSDSLEIQMARGAAMRRLRDALACAPQDGDMWLRLALVARSMGVERDSIDAYLAWSRNMAPNEGWIADRRVAAFGEGGAD